MSYDSLLKYLLRDVDFHQNNYARALDTTSKLIYYRASSRRLWLDIGAGKLIHNGYGVISPDELVSRFNSLIGLDLLADHIRNNSVLDERVTGSAGRLPFRSGSFDLITANMVIEHLEYPAEVFTEVYRALKPGGSFVFVTPNLNHPVIRAFSILTTRELRPVLARLIEKRTADDIFLTYYRANTRTGLAKLMENAGLLVERIDIHRNIPFTRSPSFLVLIECGLIRLAGAGPLKRLGATIVGVARKPWEHTLT